MRIYAAYIDPASLAEDRAVILVKDGMCWPALLFSFLWAAWHRLWWTALALLRRGGGGGWRGSPRRAPSPATGLACVAALSVYIGGAANDWRCRGLERRGRRLVAVVAGRNAEDAARRFLERGEWAVR